MASNGSLIPQGSEIKQLSRHPLPNGGERLEKILSQLPQLIWTADPSGNPTYANDLCLRYTGIDITEKRNGGWANALHHADAEFVFEKWMASMATGETFYQEYRLRSVDGHYRWFLGRAVPMRDENGEIIEWLGTCTDIHDRKMIEDSLKFRSVVLETMREGVAMVDENYIIVYTNPSQDKMFGYEAGELIGKHVSTLRPNTAESQLDLEQLMQTLKNDHVWHGTWVNCRKDGTRFRTEGHISETKIEGETYWISVQDDITDRMVADDRERRARQKMTKLQSVAASLSGAITPLQIAEIVLKESLDAIEAVAGVIFTLENDARTLSSLHSRGYGEAFDSTVQKIDIENETLISWAAKRKEIVIADDEKTLASVAAHFPHVHIKRKSAIAVPLMVGPRVLGVIGFSFAIEREFTDTLKSYLQALADHCVQALDRAEVYEKERAARQEADAANKAKSLFLANMSHEIRTPLGAILGFAELLQDSSLNDSDRALYLKTILRNGSQLSRIVNEILDLSKIESEALLLQSEIFEPKKIAEDVMQLLTLQGQEKGLYIDFKVTDEVPAFVEADSAHLRQILINLVGNAIKFTDRGSVSLTLDSRPISDVKTELVFTVSDTGIGILPSEIEHVFEPFTQADPSPTRRYGGTGLGLSVSKKFANAMGGELIVAESQPGKGTTFELSIPATLKDASAKRKVQHLNSFEGALQGMRILVVDDSLDNRTLVSRILAKSGANVGLAEDGKAALSEVASDEYDAILLDIQMPGMDGFETLQKLRENGVKIPIYALTAHAMREERERCLAAGFDEHVSKPVDKTMLLSILKGQ
ncbi:MAG TPA: PAS domain S-box protein [Bdellovibrionales bacterium]|nr:PAS domain S-box protein [Bdellovibrionales bacterium]